MVINNRHHAFCAVRSFLASMFLLFIFLWSPHIVTAGSDDPCDLFQEADLEKLSPEQKQQVLEAEKRCREQLEMKQTNEGNPAAQMRAPVIEYENPNTGQTQQFRGAQIRGEYSKTK